MPIPSRDPLREALANIVNIVDRHRDRVNETDVSGAWDCSSSGDGSPPRLRPAIGRPWTVRPHRECRTLGEYDCVQEKMAANVENHEHIDTLDACPEGSSALHLLSTVTQLTPGKPYTCVYPTFGEPETWRAPASPRSWTQIS